MERPRYRLDAGGEAILEASVGDLEPATRERLRQVCDNGWELALRKYRWLGRPWAWLLGAAVSGGLLGSSLGELYGTLEYGSFFAGAATLLVLWVLGLGAMAWRARRRRRGG